MRLRAVIAEAPLKGASGLQFGFQVDRQIGVALKRAKELFAGSTVATLSRPASIQSVNCWKGKATLSPLPPRRS